MLAEFEVREARKELVRKVNERKYPDRVKIDFTKAIMILDWILQDKKDVEQELGITLQKGTL